MAHSPSNLTGDILLDAGTNELEVLVFRLGGGHFGVNVAKVREVIRPAKTIHSPGQHPSVIGMFSIRGSVIPVVDLAKHLGLERRWKLPSESEATSPHDAPISDPPQDASPTDTVEGRIIITEFNGLRTGFMVDTVDQIHRISWQRVRPTPNVHSLTTPGNPSVAASNANPVVISSTTGVIDFDGQLVLMIDFESVSDAILLERRLHVESVDNTLNVDRSAQHVVLAEDSPFMRSILTKVFTNSGYTNLQVFADGEAAWNYIASAGESNPIGAVISDIEMPKMDGLHLTKRIKESANTRHIPVVLFSSLISEDNRKKGEQVGANAQVPKPELSEMVHLVDQAVTGQLPAASTTTAAAA